MAYQAIICAVGIYFVEDLLNLLRKYTCCLSKVSVHHFKTKQKSTVVRKVGSYLTWIHAPRLHVALREEFKDISISTTDDEDTFKCLCNNASSNEPNHPVHLENRIQELEQELLRLQAQVSNILLKTDIQDNKSSSNTDDNATTSRSLGHPPIPPPPPPPPPPLPPTPLIQTRTLLVTVKSKSPKVSATDPTSTIMEELAKRPPKLRHVQRSPGGRPIRSVPAPSDPSDILAAVLRKRFEAIHGEKQECYMLSPENTTKPSMITGH